MNRGPRKNIRLSGYDYSRVGAYFVTICTTERAPVFWKDFLCPELSPSGVIAAEEIRALGERFSSVRIEKYVIMPDHVHILLTLRGQGQSPCLIPQPALALSPVVLALSPNLPLPTPLGVNQGRTKYRGVENGLFGIHHPAAPGYSAVRGGTGADQPLCGGTRPGAGPAERSGVCLLDAPGPAGMEHTGVGGAGAGAAEHEADQGTELEVGVHPRCSGLAAAGTAAGLSGTDSGPVVGDRAGPHFYCFDSLFVILFPILAKE